MSVKKLSRHCIDCPLEKSVSNFENSLLRFWTREEVDALADLMYRQQADPDWNTWPNKVDINMQTLCLH